MNKQEYKQMQAQKKVAKNKPVQLLDKKIIQWLNSQEYTILNINDDIITLKDNEFNINYTLTINNIIERYNACKRDLIS